MIKYVYPLIDLLIMHSMMQDLGHNFNILLEHVINVWMYAERCAEIVAIEYELKYVGFFFENFPLQTHNIIIFSYSRSVLETREDGPCMDELTEITIIVHQLLLSRDIRIVM